MILLRLSKFQRGIADGASPAELQEPNIPFQERFGDEDGVLLADDDEDVEIDNLDGVEDTEDGGDDVAVPEGLETVISEDDVFFCLLVDLLALVVVFFGMLQQTLSLICDRSCEVFFVF